MKNIKYSFLYLNYIGSVKRELDGSGWKVIIITFPVFFLCFMISSYEAFFKLYREGLTARYGGVSITQRCSLDQQLLAIVLGLR
jgi:hypothetical protein